MRIKKLVAGATWVQMCTTSQRAKGNQMSRQSITLTRPNDDWLSAQVRSEEYASKSEVVNDLIRKAREIEFIRANLLEAEKIGFSEQTPEQIRQVVKVRLKHAGKM